MPCPEHALGHSAAASFAAPAKAPSLSNNPDFIAQQKKTQSQLTSKPHCLALPHFLSTGAYKHERPLSEIRVCTPGLWGLWSQQAAYVLSPNPQEESIHLVLFFRFHGFLGRGGNLRFDQSKSSMTAAEFFTSANQKRR